MEILGAGALPYSVVPPGDDEPAPLEWVLLRPLGAAPGLLEIEVEREGLLSAAAPVTALPSRQALVEALDAQRVVGGEACRCGLGWAGDEMCPALLVQDGVCCLPRTAALAGQRVSEGGREGGRGF